MLENNGCNAGEGMHCMGLDGERILFFFLLPLVT